MSDKKSDLNAPWWAKNLEDVDREVARLASICKVRLLDPGVIERVLSKDDSVCASKNKAGFDKLRQALYIVPAKLRIPCRKVDTEVHRTILSGTTPKTGLGQMRLCSECRKP